MRVKPSSEMLTQYYSCSDNRINQDLQVLRVQGKRSDFATFIANNGTQLCRNSIPATAMNNQFLKLCTDTTIIKSLSFQILLCQQFQSTTLCTTMKTSCISLSKCQSYKVQAQICYQSRWQSSYTNYTHTSMTKSKDIQYFKDKLSLSQFYLWHEMCFQCVLIESRFAGGTDGSFIPYSSSNQQNGICLLFSRCEDARLDQITCLFRQDSCLFN
ncbi:hypothetical protein pb186bvf_002404 [Paramecium bursaria]